MLNLRLSKLKFAALAAASIMLGAIWFGFAGAGAGEYYANLANQESKQSNLTAAIYHYQLASLASFSRNDHINRLADLYLQTGRPDLAIRSLKRRKNTENQIRMAKIFLESSRPQNSLEVIEAVLKEKQTPDVLIIKSKALLELGRVGEATDAARQANSFGLGNANSQLWLGLCLAVGGKDEELKTLMASVGSPEALQTLQPASISSLHLARALYAQGLLNSAGMTLEKQAGQNVEYFTLKADITLAKRPLDNNVLNAAAEVLGQGIAWGPGSLELHKRLKAVYQQLGDTDAEAAEAEIIRNLEAGKI